MSRKRAGRVVYILYTSRKHSKSTRIHIVYEQKILQIRAYTIFFEKKVQKRFSQNLIYQIYASILLIFPIVCYKVFQVLLVCHCLFVFICLCDFDKHCATKKFFGSLSFAFIASKKQLLYTFCLLKSMHFCYSKVFSIFFHKNSKKCLTYIYILYVILLYFYSGGNNE